MFFRTAFLMTVIAVPLLLLIEREDPEVVKHLVRVIVVVVPVLAAVWGLENRNPKRSSTNKERDPSEEAEHKDEPV